MVYVGVAAVIVGVLVAVQPFSTTVDALVPDVLVGPIAGAICALAGAILVFKGLGGGVA